MQKLILILLLFFSILLFSQEKSNDSLLSMVKKEYQLEQKLEIPIVEYSNKNTFYRLSYYSTIIDVWKDSLNNYNGMITKYIYESNYKKTKADTIFKKYILDEIVSKKIIDEVENINEVPDDEFIKGWKFGFDGITYSFKLLNKENYLEKSYWTPNNQDSTIVEVKKIKYLLVTIKTVINIDSLTVDFEKLYKSNHTYNDGSSWAIFILPNKNINFNYHGNYRLPLGLGIGYYQNKLNNIKLNFGTSIYYKHDLNSNYSFSYSIGKFDILKFKNYSDGLIGLYEKNRLNYTNYGNYFEKHSLAYYGTIKKNLTLEVGFDNLKTDINYNGLKLGVSKRFDNKDIKYYYNISVFENKTTNYEVGVSKRIRYKNNYLLDFDLYYEKIFYFNSLNIGFYFPLFSFQN